MSYSKSLLAGLTAAGLLTAAAAAQDREPFDGAYAGAEVGVDWTKMAGDEKFDRGIYYGGLAGFRTQMDNDLVYGLEGTFGDGGYISHRNGVNTDYEWSVSAVIGQAFDSNLLFAKAGYASMSVDYEDDATCTTCTDNSNGGWRFGAGHEYALDTGMSIRSTVDYTTYGDGVKSWQGKVGLLFRY